MLKCEVEGVKQTKGIPQGGVLSPLLANIVLNEFDWWISSQYETAPLREKDEKCYSWYFKTKKKTKLKEIYLVRYADDFKIICKNYTTAVKILEASKKWLKERLNLTVSEEKTKIINLKNNYSNFLGIRIKAQKSKKKYTAKSRISKDRLIKIKQTIKESIKMIQRYHDSRSVYVYNTIIMGVHNYYSKATNVFKDMKEIHFRMTPVLRCRLKQIGSYGYHHSTIIGFETKYFKKGTYKTWKVADEPLIPIADVNYKTNKAYKKSICNYTVSGRAELGYIELELKLALLELQNELITNENVKLHDNKISKFSMQNGKCCVSKVFLKKGNREFHHIKPRHLGGTDAYKNLCWVSKSVHKLIHCTNQEKINEYLNKVFNESGLDEKFIIKKVNKLRAEADLKEIALEI